MKEFGFIPLGIASAFGIALAATVAAWLIHGRRRESPIGLRWGATVGLGLGYVIAHRD